MRENLVVLLMVNLLTDLTLIVNIAEGLLCYRCDNINQGESCENSPASRHLRNYGVEEPCLSFEDVNNQYLALQQDIDSNWYFSVFNGDHGIPFQMLKKTAITLNGRDGIIIRNDSVTGSEGSPSALTHSDRDFACLYIRSFYYHEVDAYSDHSGTVLYFRKCVHLPSLEVYPVCTEGNIYKGQIEICVCRQDRCNFDRLVNGQQGLITGHHIVISSSPSRFYTNHYFLFFVTCLNYFISKYE